MGCDTRYVYRFVGSKHRLRICGFMARLARKGRGVNGAALGGIFKKVCRLAMQRAKIVGQRNTDRITPCRATRREIDLSGSWVRNIGNSIAGVKGLPVGDKALNRVRC